MIVADIMTGASVTDTPGETLQSAANRMWHQQTGSLLIMEDDKLVGIISIRDLMGAGLQMPSEAAHVGSDFP